MESLEQPYLHVMGPSIQSFHSVRKTEQDDDTQYYVGTIGLEYKHDHST